MKSRLFLAALATLSLAACSNDDVVNVPQQSSDAITFRSSVKNSRGTATTSTNLTEYWVKAVDADTKEYLWTHTTDGSGMLKFMQGANSASGVFEAQDAGQNDLKWPTGKTIEFFATNLAPTSYTLVGPTSTERAKYNAFKPDATIANQIDFVYASNKGSRSTFDTSVPLRFKHALSQIIIKAKNDNNQYTVKVKGYKLVYLYGQGQFTYAVPTTIEKNEDNTYTAETPDGEWTSLNKVNNQFSSYASAFFGGTGYDDASYTGLKDTNENNFYLLGNTPTVIAGSNTEGGAMVIPQEMEKLGLADANDQGKGFYIAVLVQIDDADGKAVYPGLYNTDKSKRVSYVGLPKYYGYVAAPIKIKWEPGKTYTYVLDFSSGAGYVDPEKPDVADPDNPNVPGDNTEDPHDKGEDVFGHMITFTQEVSDWEVGVSTADYPLNKTLQ